MNNFKIIISTFASMSRQLRRARAPHVNFNGYDACVHNLENAPDAWSAGELAGSVLTRAADLDPSIATRAFIGLYSLQTEEERSTHRSCGHNGLDREDGPTGAAIAEYITAGIPLSDDLTTQMMGMITKYRAQIVNKLSRPNLRWIMDGDVPEAVPLVIATIPTSARETRAETRRRAVDPEEEEYEATKDESYEDDCEDDEEEDAEDTVDPEFGVFKSSDFSKADVLLEFNKRKSDFLAMLTDEQVVEMMRSK